MGGHLKEPWQSHAEGPGIRGGHSGFGVTPWWTCCLDTCPDTLARLDLHTSFHLCWFLSRSRTHRLHPWLAQLLQQWSSGQWRLPGCMLSDYPRAAVLVSSTDSSSFCCWEWSPEASQSQGQPGSWFGPGPLST